MLPRWSGWILGLLLLPLALLLQKPWVPLAANPVVPAAKAVAAEGTRVGGCGFHNGRDLSSCRMELTYRDARGRSFETDLLVPDDQRRGGPIRLVYDRDDPGRAALAEGNPGAGTRYLLASIRLAIALVYAFGAAFLLVAGARSVMARRGARRST